MPERERIEFVADLEHPHGTMLIMDSVRQSYVDLADPTYLDFEYVQFIATVLGTLPDGPLAVTHIGGGGLTLPRYLATVRPGSSQLVLEPDIELTERVRQQLPLPRFHRIRVRPVDGLAGMAALGASSADVIVLDAYADGRVPAELTTREFFDDCVRVLHGDGCLIANIVDEPQLHYVSRVVAGLRATFGQLVLIASVDVLKGRRFGNVVVAARSTGLDGDELRRQLARQPFPAGLLDANQVARRFATAREFTQADCSPSPEPARDGWRIR